MKWDKPLFIGTTCVFALLVGGCLLALGSVPTIVTVFGFIGALLQMLNLLLSFRKPLLRGNSANHSEDSQSQLCAMFGSLLSSKARDQMFEPAFCDAKADYLKRLRQCKSKYTRRLLTFCFSLRVALMVGQCLFGYVTDSARRAVRILVK